MKTLSTPAMAAKQIKSLLKEKYPHIKFSVKSESFANGDSVRVSWNLGMKTEEIQNLVSKYEYGHFDGMTDSYEYSNVIKDIPQTKYLHCTREYMTDEEIANYKLPYNSQKDLYKEEKTLRRIIAKEICALIGIEFDGINSQVPDVFAVCYRHGQAWINWNDLVYRLLVETTFETDSWNGYKVDFDITEKGEKITNKFRIVKG